MKKYLFGLLLALSCSAFAGSAINRVLKDPAGNSATLLVESCNLTFLSDEVKKKSGAARLLIDGKLYAACYMESNGYVMIIDEEQDVYGPFPAESFVPVKEA